MSPDDPPLHVFDDVRAQYRAQFDQHGDSPAGVFWPKGRQELRWNALLAAVTEREFDLLDYGCGLGHLRAWLAEHHPGARYTGADILDAYVEHARNVAPDAAISLVRSPADLDGSFDYTVLSGVFNIRYCDSEAQHEAIVFDTLEQLFARTRRALAVNFQTPFVDFTQPGSHHQDVARLLSFTTERLSRRFAVDHATMPYEYTLTVWKDDRIRRPDNIFETGN